jgi:hypothetical protein
MGKVAAQSCFVYGCTASLGALVWYFASLAGYRILPQSVWVFAVFFSIHGIAMVITFYRRPWNPWKPVLKVTPERIRIAKLLLALVAANFLFPLAVVVSEHGGVSERALSMALTSLVLLNTVYIAIHWAIRPENLFPSWFLSFISNPLLYLLVRRHEPNK